MRNAKCEMRKKMKNEEWEMRKIKKDDINADLGYSNEKNLQEYNLI